MSFILESVCEWVIAHLLGKCLSIQVPDEFGRLADAQEVYEHLYSDGVRNWGRKVMYVFWLKNTRGTIKGFLTLCKINQTRLQ